MTKVGRNDPCPCGSGKKYKKCCLAKTSSVTDLTWQKMRQTEGMLVPVLLEYAAVRFGKGILYEAWNEFNNGVDIDIPDEEPPLEFETIFLPWFLFNWISDDYDESEVDFIEKPIAILYLEEKSHKLDSFQQRFIKSVCAEQFSFFVVTDVIPGKRLDLKDLILNRTISVHERQGSETINIGNIVFTKVMTMDDSSIMVGCAPIIIPGTYHSYFIDLRDDWRSYIKELGNEVLLEFEHEIRQIYHEINEQLHNQSPPQLINTEGDPLEFLQLHYQLTCSTKEAFAELQSLAKSINEDELFQEGIFDSHGNLESIKIPWLEKTGSEKMKGQTTLKGDLNLSVNKLIVNVNSHTRADTIKRKISRRLGKRAIFKTSVIQSTEKMMETIQQGHSSGSSQTELTSKELESQPEVQTMLKEMAAQHWQKWLDSPLPALKGKTPRESSNTSKGRERLDALFLYFEGMCSDNASEPFEPDIDLLRNKLGMGGQ